MEFHQTFFHQQLKLQILSLKWRTFHQIMFDVCPICVPKKGSYPIFEKKKHEPMLMKLTQSVNIINILLAAFCTKVFFAAFLYLLFGFIIFCEKMFVKKMLVKYW